MDWEKLLEDLLDEVELAYERCDTNAEMDSLRLVEAAVKTHIFVKKASEDSETI